MGLGRRAVRLLPLGRASPTRDGLGDVLRDAGAGSRRCDRPSPSMSPPAVSSSRSTCPLRASSHGPTPVDGARSVAPSTSSSIPPPTPELVVTLDGRRVGVAARRGRSRQSTFRGAFTIAVDGGGEATVEAIHEPPPRSCGCGRPAARAMVGHRRERRRVVPRRRLGEVGRPPPPVLPRPRCRALTVPAEALEVVCTRGLEFDRTASRWPHPGQSGMLECEPTRLVRSCRGRLVRGRPPRPHELQRRFRLHPGGRGPHAAWRRTAPGQPCRGNCLRSRVYDRDLLEQSAGNDLSWSNDEAVARMGVEYRNDLLGHVHALGRAPRRPASTRVMTGRTIRRTGRRTDRPAPSCETSTPPSATAIRPLLGSPTTVRPASSSRRLARSRHASSSPTPPSAWSTPSTSSHRRPTKARCSCYHRLLSTGLRLAATAGTDTFLSFSQAGRSRTRRVGSGLRASHGELSTVDAFKRAIRAGRTVVTNGPWLTLDVDGRGAGRGDSTSHDGNGRGGHAVVTGLGADHSRSSVPTAIAETTCRRAARRDPGLERPDVDRRRGAWAARHPHTLDASVLAHTSPVYVDIGQPCGPRRRRAVVPRLPRHVETLLDEHGHFDPATRDEHLADHRALGRSTQHGRTTGPGSADLDSKDRERCSSVAARCPAENDGTNAGRM